MTTLNVLHVIPSISAKRGGPSTTIRALTDALQLQGSRVTVATTDDDGPGRLPAAYQFPESAPGVRYLYFPRTTGFYTVSVSLGGWLIRNVDDFDLVHVHALFSFPPVVAAWLARRANVPYVVRPLGVLQSWGMEQRRAALKTVSWKTVEERLVREAAAIHFTSDIERDEAERLGRLPRGVVIPNPVKHSVADVGSQPFRESFGVGNDRFVLSLSRIDEKKGLDLLIEGFAMAGVSTTTKLVIAGDGPRLLIERLTALAERCGLGERVVWTGRLDGDLKWAALAAAEVFALTSHSENFGMAVVEALACGTPVLITESVGVSTQVTATHAGVVVRPNPADIAAALTRLLADETLRQSMGAQARLLAERYSPEVVGAEMMQLYKDILDGSGP